jgi:hypothetical protein
MCGFDVMGTVSGRFLLCITGVKGRSVLGNLTESAD